MPFRSFARKNVGYLFAVYYGAQVIFDFDDDNILTSLKDGTAITPPFFWNKQINPDTDEWQEASMLLKYIDGNDKPSQEDGEGRFAFNPFKYMGPSIPNSWPRGFPTNHLQDHFKSKPEQVDVGDLSYTAIGVIQSLCNGNPDTDAVFRLTVPNATEFTFENEATSLPLLVPYSSYSPYNAQATTHLYASFWGLFLPISVPGRVTDIWRSYFVQRIMKDVGLHVIYTPPIVQHKRSPHDYLADYAAEDDLYRKTSKLLKHLDSWASSKENLPERIVDLWIDLYEHDYIGLEDVEAIKEWLIALISIGYKFPTPVNKAKVQSPRHQPLLDGQPYRAFPYYNVDKDGKKLSENEDRPKEWLKSVSTRPRPENAIVKIIMMTMNEWPLVQTWVAYHGQLVGFQNLYIIDSSTNGHAVAFLRYARDILGANVIFSNANLNQLESIMSEIGNNLSGSSDFIIKMDTDEYLAVYDEMSKELKPSFIKPYLSNFRSNASHPLSYDKDPKMCVGFRHSTYASRDICDNDMHASLDKFPLAPLDPLGPSNGPVSGYRYKAVYDSRFIYKYGVSLGGHAVFNGVDCDVKSLFGMFHAHMRCFEIEQENNRRVLLRHNYIDESDNSDVAVDKLKKIVGCKMIDNCTCEHTLRGVASWHKAESYIKYLLCPEKAKNEYYVSLEDSVMNESFAKAIRDSSQNFGIL